MNRPLCIDLFSGLGGFTEGFLAEGFDCVGFDIERHVYGEARYPAQLVIQDVLTLHGSQFRDADIIVASPPCQAFSWMAMPWSRAKREAAWQRWERSAPIWRGNYHLTDLFDACFRIQREACEAAGRHIALVVENVKGAQPWVGPAKAHFGSFYLWGDVESVGGRIVAPRPVFGQGIAAVSRRMKSQISCAPRRFDERVAETPEQAHALHYRLPTKNDGGSWFGVAHNTESGVGQNPATGVKQGGSGPEWFDKALDERRKAAGAATKNGGDWFASGPDCSEQRRHNSKSDARKAASAMIAKIPLDLSRWIARAYKPEAERIA